ncbi:MAG: putative transporter [Candidatus Pseudobacter hemicellulosilyticus]|uniref:Transporter n=1 Tax=Candidatus Pseudobacter hemicellulosilyticus TaxID=3121375 RepID=A0AAJ6BEY0_9BACT|nr:MAG: putative transporter [Pseudobacter sp.]
MNWFIALFTEPSIAQTVVVYGLVIALGLWLGRIRILGISLGVTWVLFMGLLFSYFGIVLDADISHFLRDFGLILFVYSIGLQVGPGFFASLKKNALTTNMLAFLVVLTGVSVTLLLAWISGFPMPIMTGVMSGAVTNTPGLAAAQTAMKDLHIADGSSSMMTLAYAVAYPFGVFGIIGSLILLKKFFGVNIQHEREMHRKLFFFRSNRPIAIHLTLHNQQLAGHPLRRIFEKLPEPIVVSRIFHGGRILTPDPDFVLAAGDVLLVIAPKRELELVKDLIGPPSDMNLREAPNCDLVSRTIIVTRTEVTHKRLGDIPEIHQHDFTITRLERAGIEMVTHGNTYLQLGDTLRVVGTREGIELVAKAVGNSLKRLEHPELAPIFIGIVLGVLLGSIPIHFPNVPVPVKIGLAGGPLIVALLLSRFGSIFYLNNYTTNSANLMIRELGICLFLCSVGLGSGSNLTTAFAGGNGWWWVLMGLCITMIPMLLVGCIAHWVFRKTYFEICGLLSGASTDPPALAFALKMAGNDIPTANYATVYPLAMIFRIIAAQLLIVLFG